MQEQISAQLSSIEQVNGVTVLYAAESGSRAWGFASPDSDYDVRFIYVRPQRDYLRLDKVRDVIEWQQDEVLDINGWDLQKALRLLHNSNPTLFEWNGSPIVYKTTEAWSAIQQEFNRYFLLRAGLNHYLSTANSNYRTYLKVEEVRLKKYFYVLRPLLACKWILDRKCPPPMLFLDLVEEELEPGMRQTVDALLQLKSQTPEIGTGKRIDALNEYIDAALVDLKLAIGALPPDEKPRWQPLNDLFLAVVQSVSPS
ncbi:MAG: nucleotidyltransferase domain-containing protein [Eggerthellaceae bacterium]|nr:nucleotidyltransferase domain-containing protein [Eggerthellaceae bacterium]